MLNRHVLNLCLILITALSVSACSSALKQMADSKLTQMIDKLPVPKSVADKIHFYQKYAAKFQKYHDSGELNDNDVQDVLRDAGVITGSGATPKAGSPPRKGPPVSRVPPPVPTYAGGYRWPTDAGIISSEYGARWGKNHEGVDVAAETGEPIKASADGVIIYSGSGMRGYGNALIVRHDDKTTTLYAHNSKLMAKSGDNVSAGQTIALLGSTGRSTGPHLHFEMREGNVALNPRSKLGKPPFQALLDLDPPYLMIAACRIND